jgi:hypothetical protein
MIDALKRESRLDFWRQPIVSETRRIWHDPADAKQAVADLRREIADV